MESDEAGAPEELEMRPVNQADMNEGEATGKGEGRETYALTGLAAVSN